MWNLGDKRIVKERNLHYRASQRLCHHRLPPFFEGKCRPCVASQLIPNESFSLLNRNICIQRTVQKQSNYNTTGHLPADTTAPLCSSYLYPWLCFPLFSRCVWGCVYVALTLWTLSLPKQSYSIIGVKKKKKHKNTALERSSFWVKPHSTEDCSCLSASGKMW